MEPITFCLIVAYLFVRPAERVMHAVKGTTSPSHQAQMRRLDKNHEARMARMKAGRMTIPEALEHRIAKAITTRTRTPVEHRGPLGKFLGLWWQDAMEWATATRRNIASATGEARGNWAAKRAAKKAEREDAKSTWGRPAADGAAATRPGPPQQDVPPQDRPQPAEDDIEDAEVVDDPEPTLPDPKAVAAPAPVDPTEPNADTYRTATDAPTEEPQQDTGAGRQSYQQWKRETWQADWSEDPHTADHDRDAHVWWDDRQGRWRSVDDRDHGITVEQVVPDPPAQPKALTAADPTDDVMDAEVVEPATADTPLATVYQLHPEKNTEGEPMSAPAITSGTDAAPIHLGEITNLAEAQAFTSAFANAADNNLSESKMRADKLATAATIADVDAAAYQSGSTALATAVEQIQAAKVGGQVLPTLLTASAAMQEVASLEAQVREHLATAAALSAQAAERMAQVRENVTAANTDLHRHDGLQEQHQALAGDGGDKQFYANA